jgi:hypothetical protein
MSLEVTEYMRRQAEVRREQEKHRAVMREADETGRRAGEELRKMIAEDQELTRRIAELTPVDRSKQCTTSGQAPDVVRAKQAQDPETGQHGSYVVLCEEERAKGFVRPVRRTYIHVGVGGHEIDPENPARHGRTEGGCGVATSMGQALAETYARDPKFYTSTFCCGCNRHLPVAEFVWEDGSVLGS